MRYRLRFPGDGEGGGGDPAGNGDPAPGSGGGGGSDPPEDDWTEVRKLGTPAQVLERLGHARTWEQRAKENKDKADKWDEHERSQQSAEEQHAAALQQAQREASEATAARLRLEVAMEKGLSPTLAKRLVGGTREELEADADELAKLNPPANEGDGDGAGTGLPRRPRESNGGRPGGRPASEPKMTPADAVKAVRERRSAL